jgi:endo-1,4-beta-xylanase
MQTIMIHNRMGIFHNKTYRSISIVVFVLFLILSTLACQAGENLVQKRQPASTPTALQGSLREMGSPPPSAAEITPTPAQFDTLRSAAAKRDFRIGTAANWGFLNGEANYRDLLIQQFNLITPENEMNFERLHPAPDRYDFSDADNLVSFARQNGMLVRGGSLVWDQLLPDWLLKGDFTREQLKQILHDYIQTVVSHFRGQVVSWYVVNEAISDDGQLRDTFWLRALGPQYLALAFQWAHAADPQVMLFYNDFEGEGLNRKSDAIYALAQGLRREGIPIHGIGWQMHALLNKNPSSIEMMANFKRLADLGLMVSITEMDVRVGTNQQERPARLQVQAGLYRRALRACLDAPNCDAFEVWGVTDRYSWFNYKKDPSQQDAPLLFDENGNPKPAYFALLDELNK